MSGAVEVWRGQVNAWNCDEMGHMNVRFYVAFALEGLAGLARALGMPDAFRADAEATLALRWMHLRYLKEAREGAPLHMTAQLAALDETEAEAVLMLVHSLSDEVCAAITVRVIHVTAREAKPFPWSGRSRAAAPALTLEAPAVARPRGVGPAPERLTGSTERADALGLRVIGRGSVGAEECDAFGRWRADAVMGRISDAAAHLFSAFRRFDPAPGAPRIGGAMLEGRLVFDPAAARAGDHFVIRSAITAQEEKIRRRVDWVLDPVTGRPWVGLEAVAAALDLDARKLVAPDPEDRAAVAAALQPTLTL